MGEWFSLKWFSIGTLGGFHWSQPYYLYGIAAVPFLFFLRRLFYGKSRQRLNVAFLAKEVKTSWVQYLRYLPAILSALGIMLVLVALARPQLIKETEERFSEGIEIVLALDVSDSMLMKDLTPNRLESAKKVATEFVEGRFQDKIGLVVFAGQAFFLCPLTTDYELLKQQIASIKPDIIATAGTAIGSALANCINLMRDSESKSKVAILLSDGDNTAGNLDPITAAQLANAYGIRVYTIAVGKEDAVVTQDSTDMSLETLDTAVLKDIAQRSKGQFFQVQDARSLKNVFERINRLEKINIKVSYYQDIKDFYHIYLKWGICCLLGALALKCTFMGNILED